MMRPLPGGIGLAPPNPNVRPRGISAANDEFGMLGFNQNDALSQIYRPVDLNSLGIAVSSVEQLHLAFGSPWLDQPAQRLQPEFRIPECYYVTAPVIKYTLFQKLHLETLFYIFYSMPRDVLQVAAARELNSRDWRYHKPMQKWLSRVPGTEPKSVPGYPKGAVERGNYQVWCVEKWAVETMENFSLQLADLEEVAATAPQQQQQQQPPALPAAGQQAPGVNNVALR